MTNVDPIIHFCLPVSNGSFLNVVIYICFTTYKCFHPCLEYHFGLLFKTYMIIFTFKRVVMLVYETQKKFKLFKMFHHVKCAYNRCIIFRWSNWPYILAGPTIFNFLLYMTYSIFSWHKDMIFYMLYIIRGKKFLH